MVALKILEFVIGIKGQYILIEKIELLARSGTTALDVGAVREGAKNPIPYDHATAKIRIAVVEIVGVMQLVVFGRCKEPVPNARAHGQVGMSNPPVAKTKGRTDCYNLGGCSK